jgi:CBS domain-containing protein
MDTTETLPRVGQLPARRLVTIAPDATLREAAQLMRAEDVSALVVGTPGELIAIVTERDITAAVADGRPSATPVTTLATAAPITVRRDADIGTAAARMVRLGVRHLVVVDGDRAVGIVSIRDALAVLLRAVTPEPMFVVLSRQPDLTELWLG